MKIGSKSECVGRVWLSLLLVSFDTFISQDFWSGKVTLRTRFVTVRSLKTLSS